MIASTDKRILNFELSYTPVSYFSTRPLPALLSPLFAIKEDETAGVRDNLPGLPDTVQQFSQTSSWSVVLLGQD